jgi:hypothetical protein
MDEIVLPSIFTAAIPLYDVVPTKPTFMILAISHIVSVRYDFPVPGSPVTINLGGMIPLFWSS